MQRCLAPIAIVTILVAGAAQAGGDPIPVCVGENGGLRLIETNHSCKPGEEKKLFTEWEAEVDEPEEEGERMEAMTKRMQELSRRIAALEADPDREARASSQRGAGQDGRNEPASASSRAAVHRVTAPFEVVGRSGNVILRVAEKVSSTSGEGAQVTIGAGDSGNYGLRVHAADGTFIAGIGQSRDGHGLVTVMDDEGRPAANMSANDRAVSVFGDDALAASMFAADRGGTVAVYQGQEPVAYLTRSSHGNGGNVTLTRADGFGVFSAGSASDGGGEACLNRVTGGGKQRNVCLGVELPSMGLGK